MKKNIVCTVTLRKLNAMVEIEMVNNATYVCTVTDHIIGKHIKRKHQEDIPGSSSGSKKVTVSER